MGYYCCIMEQAINNLVQRLEAVTARLEKVEGQLGAGGAPAGGAPQAAGSGAAGAAWVGDFDAFYNENVPKFVELSNKLGNDQVKQQVAAFESALKSHREFLNIASKCDKPDDATLAKLLEPTSKSVGEVISVRDSNRGNEMWNQLSALSETAPAFGWVTVSPTPAPFVNEFKGNGEFYTNKILREFKGKDEDQVAWVNALKGFFTGLVAFIKQHHTTGLVWKKGGENASAYVAAAPAKKGPDMNALFSAINKGTGISSGLKKVTSDMKTKNRDPNDRSAVVKAAPKKATTTRGKPAKRGSPKFALEGNKWVCEFQDDQKTLAIEETEPRQTVYLYKNDNCIAVVELVNCNGVEIQCQGKVPSFAIDKCSSIQVILSKECLDTEIVTSKSDQVNVLIPDGDDLTELAVPEQYKTTIVDNKLVTNCVEHI